MAGTGQGFSLLLECIQHPEGYESDQAVLEDAILLINGRWNLEGSVIVDDDGKHWGWVVCTRFLVSTDTVRRALGDMVPDYVRFYRGSATQTSGQAIKLVKLKRKWNVEDTQEAQSSEVSGSGSGQGPLSWKRPRY